jgi:hypothetical protein
MLAPFARPQARHSARSADPSACPAPRPSVTRVSYHSLLAITSRPAPTSARNSAGVISFHLTSSKRGCDGDDAAPAL